MIRKGMRRPININPPHRQDITQREILITQLADLHLVQIDRVQIYKSAASIIIAAHIL